MNSQFSDFDIENDYSNVHFTLIPNFIDLESKVYIIGEFNNFNPNKNHELTLKGNKFKGNFKLVTTVFKLVMYIFDLYRG